MNVLEAVEDMDSSRDKALHIYLIHDQVQSQCGAIRAVPSVCESTAAPMLLSLSPPP